MFLRRPWYYEKFRCIASACTDSCCAGWEIDIDPDTLDYYMKVKGAFGKRLRENICMPETDNISDAAELPHFIQTADERCPFLNDCNLCDIFITLGEAHLSQICTYHPRFFDWFINGQEAGLGLACEEAVRLTLLPHTGEYFETVETDETPEEDADDPESRAFEITLEDTLFGLRNMLFGLIDRADRDNELPGGTADAVNAQAGYCQKVYDTLLFGEAADTEEKEESFTAAFFSEEKLRARLECYETLEINDPAWWETLERLKERLPALLSMRADFEEAYREKLYEYRNLLRYFLFRHFMMSRLDSCVAGRIRFALQAVLMIELLGIDRFMETGRLTLRDQINLCKLYSKEIEYDEDNTAALIEREETGF